MSCVRYFCHILTKLGMCRQIFGNVLQYKISRKSIQQLSGSYMQTDGLTDISEEAGGIIFAHFCCERAKTISDAGNMVFRCPYTQRKSRENSVGISGVCGLESWLVSLHGAKDCSLQRPDRIWGPRTRCRMDTCGSFPGGKPAGA